MFVYLKTFGCQMNKSDSERMLALLEREGYQPCDSIEQADLAIANTCSIRAKAEDKLFSLLGEWKLVKKQKKLVIAVVGCIAQQEGEALRKRVPEIDLVLGTHTYHQLPEALAAFREANRPQVLLGSIDDPIPDDLPSVPQGQLSAWVTVMQGCTNFCSYCIVPYTRGPEKSRSLESIKQEIEGLVQKGFKEFSLLGQNVNVYGKDLGTSLSALLQEVSSIPGVDRIRFITSHPRDFDEELVLAVKHNPQVCEYFHLPIQAGADKVLREMNRGYTREEYLEKVAMIKKHLPDAAISTDLIVGFPGETEEEFEQTLAIVEEVGYDLANTAAYSIRPYTEAGKREDQIPEVVKSERLNRLNKLVLEVASKKNQGRIGKTEEVLVEGREADGRYRGRTRTNKMIFFPSDQELTGKLVSVQVVGASPWALQATL